MLKLDVSGIQRALRKVERFRLSMPEIVGDEVARQVVEFAGSSNAPDGSQWKPLTPAYAKRKQKRGFPPVANKRVTGGFLLSVKNRQGVVGPDERHTPQAQGLEKKRVSFEASPITAGNVERLLLKEWNAIT